MQLPQTLKGYNTEQMSCVCGLKMLLLYTHYALKNSLEHAISGRNNSTVLGPPPQIPSPFNTTNHKMTSSLRVHPPQRKYWHAPPYIGLITTSQLPPPLMSLVRNYRSKNARSCQPSYQFYHGVLDEACSSLSSNGQHSGRLTTINVVQKKKLHLL